MKISFEQWLDRETLDADASSCFRESILCYKAGAYKAAVQFCYVGILLVIKDRILRATAVPSGVPPGQWTNIQTKLRSVDEWDEQAFTCTQMKNPAPVFVLADDVRRQFLYWRDRRNDCAHGKDLGLGASHVETIFYFCQQIVPRLRVNGSLQYFVNEVIDFYDVSKTPSGQDPTPLIREIGESLTMHEKGSFPTEISSRFDAARTLIEKMAERPNENELEFFDRVLALGDNDLQEAVSRYVISNLPYLLRFLRRNPINTRILSNHSDLVRPLWHAHLFNSSYPNDLTILASMIRHNLIPPIEWSECFEHCIRKGIAGSPTDVDKRSLVDAGFFATLHDLIVNNGYLRQFDPANKSRALIIMWLQDTTIDESIAEALRVSFSDSFHPWKLKSDLEAFFASSPSKRAEYHATGVAAPPHLHIENP